LTLAIIATTSSAFDLLPKSIQKFFQPIFSGDLGGMFRYEIVSAEPNTERLGSSLDFPFPKFI